MNQQDLKIYELLADKTLSFGCKIIIKDEYIYNVVEKNGDDIHCTHNQFTNKRETFTMIISESVIGQPGKFILGHEPTLTDLHRWIIPKVGEYGHFSQYSDSIIIDIDVVEYLKLNDLPREYINMHIAYDGTKTLMEQSETTKQEIIDLIETEIK